MEMKRYSIFPQLPDRSFIIRWFSVISRTYSILSVKKEREENEYIKLVRKEAITQYIKCLFALMEWKEVRKKKKEKRKKRVKEKEH